MNFIERYIDRKLRRIAWKATDISNNKKRGSKGVIDEPLQDTNLRKRIESQEGIMQSSDASDNKNNSTLLESYELDEDVVSRINSLQELFLNQKYQNYSDEEMIQFLRSAMNYGKFQLWLIENKLNGVELSLNDKLKRFLSETSDAQILGLYDVEQSFNNAENLVEKYETEIKQEKGFAFQKFKKNK